MCFSSRLILKVATVMAFMFTDVVQLNAPCLFILVCESVCPWAVQNYGLHLYNTGFHYLVLWSQARKWSFKTETISAVQNILTLRTLSDGLFHDSSISFACSYQLAELPTSKQQWWRAKFLSNGTQMARSSARNKEKGHQSRWAIRHWSKSSC